MEKRYRLLSRMTMCMDKAVLSTQKESRLMEYGK
jgi:hypothetical protein